MRVSRVQIPHVHTISPSAYVKQKKALGSKHFFELTIFFGLFVLLNEEGLDITKILKGGNDIYISYELILEKRQCMGNVGEI